METVSPLPDALVMDAISLAEWKRRRLSEKTAILIADTFDHTTEPIMVGTVVSEPNTKDEHAASVLHKGAQALFSAYGACPLDGQKMMDPGTYVCHLHFVLGVMEGTESVEKAKTA